MQLLINPSSGGRRVNRVLESAGRHFQGPEWRLLAHVLGGPGEAYLLARASARAGRWAVLVAGGDGTINEVARALLGSKTRLGVIPAGTGNGFARALGLPMGIEKACRALVGAGSFACDAGILDRQRIFVNVCGVGADAWIAARANELRWVTRVSGFLRYAGAGLMSVTGFRPPSLSIKADGLKVFEGPVMAAVVANSEQYGLGTVIAPGARLDDGRFDLIVVPPLPLLSFLAASLRMLRGLPVRQALRLTPRSVEIRVLEGRAPVHLDGEPAGFAPLRIRMKRSALRVLRPS